MDRREISHYVLQFSGQQKDLPLVMWQNGKQRDISSDLQNNGQQRDVPLGSVVQWIIDRSPIRLCTTMDSKDLSNMILQYNRKQRNLRIVESREISHQVLQYNEQQRDPPLVLWYNCKQRDLPIGFVVQWIVEISPITTEIVLQNLMGDLSTIHCTTEPNGRSLYYPLYYET